MIIEVQRIPVKTDLFQCITFVFLSGPVRPEGDANILLVGSGDPRHILKSIAGLQDKENLHVRLNLKKKKVIGVQCLCKPFGRFVCKKLFCFAGVGGGEQHGGGGQTAAAAVPGADATAEHRKQWYIDSNPVNVSAQHMFSFKILSFYCSEKAEIFLEIFGNSEIRAQTEETLKCVASNLSQSVTETLETPTHSCLNTTSLKVPAGVKYANLWPH